MEGYEHDAPGHLPAQKAPLTLRGYTALVDHLTDVSERCPRILRITSVLAPGLVHVRRELVLKPCLALARSMGNSGS